jgi:hypothetical protein
VERHQRNQRAQGLLRPLQNNVVLTFFMYPKFVYVLSVALFAIASAIVALSKTIGLVIGMRGLQAAG